jgi:DNA mismatch repair ATPase MutL
MGNPSRVDHEDGDGLNNRRRNLRACTQSQNVSNHLRLQQNNTTGFFGVTYMPNRKSPYRASVFVNGRRVSGGYFTTAMEAAVARDVLAIEHHGEFASLNFPRSD